MVGADRSNGDLTYWAAGIAAVALLGAVFALIGGESLTYDEATYAELGTDPPGSDYYPGDVFMRHPPLAYAAIWAWHAIVGSSELALRGLSLAWSAGGTVLLTMALRARRAPAALALVPAVSLPVTVPLLSVTMYPPMFFFLALAAWGHASGRRGWAIAGWNLALLCHEIVLLLVAAVLLPAAWRAVREARPWWRVPLEWLRVSAPYPAAWAWGLLLVARTALQSDPRTGTVATSLGDPVAWDILRIEPLHTLAIGLALSPVLLVAGRRMLSRSDREPDWGAAAFGLFILAVSPFYRYVTAPLPLIVGAVERADVARFAGVGGVALVVLSGLAATGVAYGAMTNGWDPVNDADIPGIVDYDAGSTLLRAGDVAGTRSPPALAYYLQQDGWVVVGIGPNGPSAIELERGTDRITLVAAVTPGQMERASNVTALIVPNNWPNALGPLKAGGWTETSSAGNLHRLEPPAGSGPVGT